MGDTSNEDLGEAFGKHGTVTDSYNTGKGFAFVTFSTPDEAQAAIAAMSGTNVCGRDIDCNIAKPRAPAGGGGDRGRGRGGGDRGRGGGRGRGGRGGAEVVVEDSASMLEVEVETRKPPLIKFYCWNSVA